MAYQYFNHSSIGASHIASGKPCQDYSLSWQSDDATQQILIVADGHGSSTYVRSDVGSRLAAEIALRHTRHMLDTIDMRPLIGRSVTATARPIASELRHYERNTDRPHAQDFFRQKEQFEAQVKGKEDIDKMMMRLFNALYDDWLAAITADARQNPFTDAEKARLGDADLVKAYGSTLMVYAQTPLMWMAFHIGDGRIMGAQRSMRWYELVPWDFRCFLNVTTSLCNDHAPERFRYTLNATGLRPSFVCLCSDGVEDSYAYTPESPDRLVDFYCNMLGLAWRQDIDKVRQGFVNFAPSLSERGSKDDISLAMLIDMEALPKALEVYSNHKSKEQLVAERRRREEGLSNKRQQIAIANDQLTKIDDNSQSAKNAIDTALETIIGLIQKVRDNRLKRHDYRQQHADQLKAIQQLEQDLNAAEQSAQADESKAQEAEATLRRDYEAIKGEIRAEEEQAKAQWQALADKVKAAEDPSANGTPAPASAIDDSDFDIISHIDPIDAIMQQPISQKAVQIDVNDDDLDLPIASLPVVPPPYNPEAGKPKDKE